jgi:hypothetical protein
MRTSKLLLIISIRGLFKMIYLVDLINHSKIVVNQCPTKKMETCSTSIQISLMMINLKILKIKELKRKRYCRTAYPIKWLNQTSRFPHRNKYSLLRCFLEGSILFPHPLLRAPKVGEIMRLLLQLQSIIHTPKCL